MSKLLNTGKMMGDYAVALRLKVLKTRGRICERIPPSAVVRALKRLETLGAR